MPSNSSLNWTRDFGQNFKNTQIQKSEADAFIKLMKDPRLFGLAKAEMGSVFRMASESDLDEDQAANPIFMGIHRRLRCSFLMETASHYVLKGVDRVGLEKLKMIDHGTGRR